ncbi:hypothetical protein AVEN_258650-1 [Araneus ventricosus]|uniref:Uncharacterized protein n=1 Tax=Araneus ventricosus TaxID=182803 RepID=A0A4Y2JJX7_ARAVE|nr:hypothetical protein AVEN_258650-1 [Araneus ventricosus]
MSEREWEHLQCIRKKVTESCKSLMFGDFFRKRQRLEMLTPSPHSNLEMKLYDVIMILSTSLKEMKTISSHFKDRIEDVLVCKGCLGNKANLLGHECVTINYETRHRLYEDLALFSIGIELLVKEFAEKNIQMLNYINETFLNDLNTYLLIKIACDSMLHQILCLIVVYK